MKVFQKEKGKVLMWYYDFTLNGRRITRSLAPVADYNKRQATMLAEKIRADLSYKKKSTKRVPQSIKAVFKGYLDFLQEHKPETWKNYKTFYNANLSYFTKLDEVTIKDIRAYQKKRKAEGASGSTINRELESARAAFNKAIKEKEWADENPFAHFDKHKEVSRERYLTGDELSKLLIACKLVASEMYNPHIYEIVLLGILLGRRKQEILKLNHLVCDSGIPKIDINSMMVVTKATGTNKYSSNSYTPIPQEALPVIKELIEKSKGGFLFENPRTGKPYDGVKRSFASALKLAGIHDFHFHDLRHTYATYILLASGGDLKGAQVILGHKDIRTTAKYTHVLDSRKKEMVGLAGDMITKLASDNTRNVNVEEMRGRMSNNQKAHYGKRPLISRNPKSK